MPSTVNGIGTAYHGKRNAHTRMGVCEHCQRAVELRSYETRLWIVVLFIPVIPLRRYQILDLCPACAWHRAVPLGDWERARARAIQEAGERLAANPKDAEAGIELHGALVAFQRSEEAARLAEVLAGQFADDAGVQFYLGGWHDLEKRDEVADACFEKALSLEPENRAFRRVVAIGCIRKGGLARARDLVSFMETAEEGRDPGVLLSLANAYAARREHGDALRFYRLALAAAPSLGQDKDFRRKVAVAEKLSGELGSMLPSPPRRPGRKLALVGIPVAALAALALFSMWSHYASSHQTLHIVNGLREAMTVWIDGGGKVQVAAKSRATVSVSEGRHAAKVSFPETWLRPLRRAASSGPIVEVKFEVSNSLAERVRGDGVFVLNPLGAATLVREEAVYAALPQAGGAGASRFYLGEAFMTFRGIDYAFGEFPKSLRSKGGAKRKSRLGVVAAEPATLLEALPAEVSAAQRLAYAEGQLRLNPEDEALLLGYHALAAGEGRLERCREFLEERIADDRVGVPWHRKYQDVCWLTGHGEKLAALYEKMLAAQPGDSDLLYLKGRLLARISEALPLFEQAIRANPTNAYPWLAKGYCLAARAEFEEAKKCLVEANRLGPGVPDVGPLLLDARVALDEYAALEDELRGELKRAPLSGRCQESLLRVLVANGKIDEARRAHEAYRRVARAKAPRTAEHIAARSLLALCYLTDEMDLYESAARAVRDRMPEQELMAVLEQGRLDEARQFAAPQRGITARYLPLLLSLAWRAKGNGQLAETWRRKAVETLAAGTPAERMMADLLGQGEKLSLSDADDLAARPDVKAALLVALAGTCPARHADLLARAERLNLFGYFPYRFLRRIIEEMKQ